MTTLMIIGNGFDMAHGLHTSYGDLKEFVAGKDKSIYDQINDQLFIGNKDSWNNFESNVGTDDSYFENGFQETIENAYQTALDMDTGGDPMRGDTLSQMENNDYAREKEISNLLYLVYNHFNFEELYSKFISFLEEMLEIEDKKSVEVNSVVKSKVKKESNTKFITFNYTHTLEKNYNIPQTSILHIHGELGKDELIFGNQEDKLTNLNPLEFTEKDHEAEEHERNCEAYNVLSDEEKECYFPPETGHDYSAHPTPNAVDSSDYVEQYNVSKEEWIKVPNIDEFDKFISELEVDKIIVIGHSLGLVDDEYFNSLEKKFPNAQWEVSVYESETRRDEVRDNFKELFPAKKACFFTL